MKGGAQPVASGAAAREKGLAVGALLIGALTWGLIWYPYRILRDAGVDGIVASTITYGLALVPGGFLAWRSSTRFALSWSLFWLALSAAGCNLGYVLATLHGEVMRVLLLFYLAPLWTVVLARLLLDERVTRVGALAIALSLAGAATMLWQPQLGLPVPQDGADWLGLLAGFSFAVFNVLSRRAREVSVEHRVLAAFAGVVVLGVLLLLVGFGRPALPASAPLWGLLAVLAGILVAANLVVQFGLARLAANRAIVIMLSEIGFAALGAWLLAGEEMAPREWVGGALIVAASVFTATSEE